MPRIKKYPGVYPRVLTALEFAEANPSSGKGVRVATQDLINQAVANYPTCRCREEHGLVPGLSLYQINQMGAGCMGSNAKWEEGPDHKKHWIGRSGSVCPALDKLRRLMGH